MTRRTSVAGAAALCATILVSAGLLAQDAQDNPYGQMTPEQQAEMQAWEKYATPGKQHEMLQARVGEWTFAGKWWQDPDQEPAPFEGTSTVTSVIGGRYFMEKLEGPGFMGEPFEGRSVFGYDNLTQTYFVIWFDNMMTGVARYDGTPSGDGTTIHYTAEVPDPVAGVYKKTRAVDKKINDDTYTFTMYDTTPGGREFVTMEIVSTRKGAEKATTRKGY